jgi:hypothetical protein
MKKALITIIILCSSLLMGEEFQIYSGEIIRLDDFEARDAMTCPDLVDSCIYVCGDGSSNPCHPENLYSIVVDSSTGDTVTSGSRFRLYFPWEYAGLNANKFRVTASWPALSPTAVYASGNYAYFDVIGHDPSPGTVQASIWYGTDCQDSDGNIGADWCLELIGRFCFAPGDTLDWPEDADQNISTDVCDACWMSSPAWDAYDTYPYSDPVLSPGTCAMFDHCHHSEPDSILCGVGYMDGENYPPADFSLIEPSNNYEIMIDASNVDDGSITFSWGESSDANGELLSYHFISTSAEIDNQDIDTSATSFSVAYADIIEDMTDNNVTVATIEWTVHVTDGIDTVEADNAPFTISIDGGYAMSTYLEGSIPNKFALHQSYPNPFNGCTVLSYSLPQESDISLIIYDLQGRLVKTVAEGQRNAGRFAVSWDGTSNQGQSVSSGVYLVQLQAENYTAKRKVVYLK